ncbi:PDZ domain-containing protein [Paucibacter sp. TC2R-5]|uniref:PDZ domain-containing protein n=1 Tax=Paucibacter sp. TC2R-5 TaxID=2893555 RepID=UPI0021E36927|nr:PDZ domain-containing protein [Paucibacter sp. TC2R-5]
MMKRKTAIASLTAVLVATCLAAAMPARSAELEQTGAAGELSRKGVLGVGAKALDDLTAKTLGVNVGDGLLITLVLAGSSADQMGFKVGDLLLSLNGHKFARFEDLAAFTRNLREGSPLEALTLSASGERQMRQGLAQGRPLETSEYAQVRYGAAPVSLGTLRTISHIPKSGANKSGKLPTIFWLQGYSCDSQEYPPNSTHAGKRLIDDWTRAGYAVFRVERPNIGDSRASKDCRDIDYEEELALHQQVYRQLLKQDFVDPAQIFFFGHSMGSVTAPLLAQVHQPKGIMVYGVVMRSWLEYFIDHARIQSTYTGSSHVEAEAKLRAMLPVYYGWLEQGQSPQQLKAQNLGWRQLLEAGGNDISDGDYMYGRNYKFWQQMNQRPMAAAWSQVSGKVLAMYGEFDLQALHDRDAKSIAAVVNESHPGQGSYLLVPGTEHAFIKVGSYQEAAALAEPGKMLPALQERYNPELGRLTVEWLAAAVKP